MKILFLQNRLLYPADTGGKIRTLNILRHLARRHEITYLCGLHADEQIHVPHMRELGLRVETVPLRPLDRGSLAFYRALGKNLLSACPFSIAKHYSPELRGRAASLLVDEPYDLLICDFLQMARHAMGLPAPAKILFQHNVEARILQRHARADGGWLRRRYMALQGRRMHRFEAAAGRHFDAVIAVSPQDRAVFEGDYGWRHVHLIDTAVDLDHFRPSPLAEIEGRVLFLGAMDWLPNIDGVRYFAREVWPLLRRARPDATFQIVGRHPPAEVVRLREIAGIDVTGSVPDVRPYLAQAAVVVVPLRIGSGTRLKIFEAMAMKKALVSTTIGAEGLPVVSGKHLLLGDTPEELAGAVAFLLGEAAHRANLATAAWELVTSRFGSATVAGQFEQICHEVVRNTAAGDRLGPAGMPDLARPGAGNRSTLSRNFHP